MASYKFFVMLELNVAMADENWAESLTDQQKQVIHSCIVSCGKKDTFGDDTLNGSSLLKFEFRLDVRREVL